MPQAGKNKLTLDEIRRLHTVLIEDTRFTKAGLRPVDGRIAEKGERRKYAKDAHNACSNRRQCPGHRDGEVRPAIQEATQRAVGVADIDVFAAGLRLHRAEFSVLQSAAYREQAANDPGSKHEPG
jgi:hypothetical protein